MIRIVLLGRTGNNMFQYALGRVLAEKHGVPLVMDASWFNAEGWAEVSHFLKLPLKAKVVRRCSVGARALRKLTGKHYWEFLRKPLLKESPDDQSFAPHFLEAPPDCMLFGYFQTPLYFQSIASELRNELNGLLSSHAPFDDSYLPKVTAQGSVAVHVRRGDYLNHPALQVCGLEYYQSAFRQMREWVPGCRFLIFSDDPVWCRTQFKEADMEVIDSGTASANPLHDLHLISRASHHIIANSSYSWWAAWLASKDGQRVLMPDRWFAHSFIAPIEEKRLPHWTIVS